MSVEHAAREAALSGYSISLGLEVGRLRWIFHRERGGQSAFGPDNDLGCQQVGATSELAVAVDLGAVAGWDWLDDGWTRGKNTPDVVTPAGLEIEVKYSANIPTLAISSVFQRPVALRAYVLVSGPTHGLRAVGWTWGLNLEASPGPAYPPEHPYHRDRSRWEVKAEDLLPYELLRQPAT